MSREDYDVFDDLDARRKALGEDRRTVAEILYAPARELASRNGLTLRRCSESHYQLFPEGQIESMAHWLLNLYPGNQRLYWDKNRKGPFLKVRRPWTLVDAVQAAINVRPER